MKQTLSESHTWDVLYCTLDDSAMNIWKLFCIPGKAGQQPSHACSQVFILAKTRLSGTGWPIDAENLTLSRTQPLLDPRIILSFDCESTTEQIRD